MSGGAAVREIGNETGWSKNLSRKMAAPTGGGASGSRPVEDQVRHLALRRKRLRRASGSPGPEGLRKPS